MHHVVIHEVAKVCMHSNEVRVMNLANRQENPNRNIKPYKSKGIRSIQNSEKNNT